MMHLLRNDSQAAWVILSTAMAHQLDYILTLRYPSDMLEWMYASGRLWSSRPANIAFPGEKREQESSVCSACQQFRALMDAATSAYALWQKQVKV